MQNIKCAMVILERYFYAHIVQKVNEICFIGSSTLQKKNVKPFQKCRDPENICISRIVKDIINL